MSIAKHANASPLAQYRAAAINHKDDAEIAWCLYVKMCGGKAPPRVPGMATIIRLAWRIQCGRTPQEAAAREYVYRWKLAVQSPIFGVPHLIGM